MIPCFAVRREKASEVRLISRVSLLAAVLNLESSRTPTAFHLRMKLLSLHAVSFCVVSSFLTFSGLQQVLRTNAFEIRWDLQESLGCLLRVSFHSLLYSTSLQQRVPSKRIQCLTRVSFQECLPELPRVPKLFQMRFWQRGLGFFLSWLSIQECSNRFEFLVCCFWVLRVPWKSVKGVLQGCHVILRVSCKIVRVPQERASRVFEGRISPRSLPQEWSVMCKTSRRQKLSLRGILQEFSTEYFQGFRQTCYSFAGELPRLSCKSRVSAKIYLSDSKRKVIWREFATLKLLVRNGPSSSSLNFSWGNYTTCQGQAA